MAVIAENDAFITKFFLLFFDRLFLCLVSNAIHCKLGSL